MPQIVPSALKSVKSSAIMSVELFRKYLGASGIPNHPVDSRPANVSVINRYLAALWFWMLKNNELHPQIPRYPPSLLPRPSFNTFACR